MQTDTSIMQHPEDVLDPLFKYKGNRDDDYEDDYLDDDSPEQDYDYDRDDDDTYDDDSYDDDDDYNR